MKVYRHNQWSREENSFHAVEKGEWKQGKLKMLALQIDTYCARTYNLLPRDKYEVYDKELHRKKMCEDCVKVLKRKIAERRKGV